MLFTVVKIFKAFNWTRSLLLLHSIPRTLREGISAHSTHSISPASRSSARWRAYHPHLFTHRLSLSWLLKACGSIDNMSKSIGKALTWLNDYVYHLDVILNKSPSWTLISKKKKQIVLVLISDWSVMTQTKLWRAETSYRSYSVPLSAQHVLMLSVLLFANLILLDIVLWPQNETKMLTTALPSPC